MSKGSASCITVASPWGRGVPESPGASDRLRQRRRHRGSTVAAFWKRLELANGSLHLWHYGVMAIRKMTFSVPEPLASQFLRIVASRDRSRFVSEALAARLR